MANQIISGSFPSLLRVCYKGVSVLYIFLMQVDILFLFWDKLLSATHAFLEIMEVWFMTDPKMFAQNWMLTEI